MNVHEQFESFDEILSLRRRCIECCAGSYKSFHCPFCSTSKFKPAKECKLLSHLESHWKNRLAVGNGKYVVKCNLEQCSTLQTGHYHCSKCDRIISRKDVAERHFRRCTSNVFQVTAETDRHTAETDENVAEADHQVEGQGDHVTETDNHNTGTGDHVAETDDHVAETEDHVAETDDHVAETDDHVAQTDDHVAETDLHGVCDITLDEHNYWIDGAALSNNFEEIEILIRDASTKLENGRAELDEETVEQLQSSLASMSRLARDMRNVPVNSCYKADRPKTGTGMEYAI
ncbi:unnamed protein product [Mytilus coruscus]|uniref:Uncharacterized protein n=1 Tax=Mytilus coruscus TaxID=42192 RepID=A0A6J8DVS0_MYTCO|nr:unnamed protein product [Mytilus coruscus]